MWKILKFNENIFFQTEDNLFIFDGENIKVLPIHGFLRSLFHVNKKLFLVDTQKGLLEYKNGNLHTLPESEFFKNDEVNMILPFSNGDLLIFSWRRKKLYRYNFRDVLPWKNGLTEVAMDYPFCGIMYENKFVIGTTENGIYFIDEGGNIVTHLNVKSGLIYNKVFNLYKDNSRNIWVCYEYGLDKLSYQLPIKLINKHINVPGSAYGATKIGEEIFFLTSTGIYSSPYSCLKSFNGQKDDFTLWEGEKGPSYWIKKVGKRYFFGNLFGLHFYEAGKKKQFI